MKASKEEQLNEMKARNLLLSSTVKELRMEIGFYRGETKRLEIEKTLLSKEKDSTSTTLSMNSSTHFTLDIYFFLFFLFFFLSFELLYIYSFFLPFNALYSLNRNK